MSFCFSVGRSVGRNGGFFAMTMRASACFLRLATRERADDDGARPRDANINAALTTLSFDHCILCIHTHWETKLQFERVGFFSLAHASSSTELVPLVCFHRGLEKYTSISLTLSGMYSVKFSFCPVVVLPIAYILIPSSSTSSSLEHPPPLPRNGFKYFY